MFLKLCKITIFLLLFEHYCVKLCIGLQVNKSHHTRKDTLDNVYYRNQQVLGYRSYQPIALKYHKIYPKPDERADYDITSYDTEYGGVVSNFTSTIYDDNPPLYPNPEIVSRHSNPVNVRSNPDTNQEAQNVDIPEDSLADGDLKDHNIIDSVTYVYGSTNCYGAKDNWTVLIYLACAVAISLLTYTVVWLLCKTKASEFRNSSKLYPISINLCCCLGACTVIYLQAVVGVSSPTHCEKIALLLHYAYLVCAVWIVLLSASVTEYLLYNAVLPLKYNYLLAYGIPAIFVMFNYALSMEHYEIKHYCWMSLEKGMVFGFMAPITTLILINTVIVIIGLQSIFDKQADMLKEKIYDLVESFSKSEQKNIEQKIIDNDVGSSGSSRKNTDTSDTFERECDFSEDDLHYVYLEHPVQETNMQPRTSPERARETQGYKSVLWIDVELESVAVRSRGDAPALKAYLTLALVLEPFYAVNWVMGVLVIENANYWSTPLLYLFLITVMFTYLSVTLSSRLPIVPVAPSEPCCVDVVIEPALNRSRTTDSIPLLDPSIQQPTVSPPPGDSISTISI